MVLANLTKSLNITTVLMAMAAITLEWIQAFGPDSPVPKAIFNVFAPFLRVDGMP